MPFEYNRKAVSILTTRYLTTGEDLTPETSRTPVSNISQRMDGAQYNIIMDGYLLLYTNYRSYMMSVCERICAFIEFGKNGNMKLHQGIIEEFFWNIGNAMTILGITDARPTSDPLEYKADASPLEPNCSLLPFYSRVC
jgi:hypothetical protein